MRIYSIYKITNTITGECYIGCTKDFDHRIKQHKKSTNAKLAMAINQYGHNNFLWEVLYQSKNKNYCFNVMEPYFIKEYNSIKNGYNTTPGGLNTKDKPFYLTNEMFEKLSEIMK